MGPGDAETLPADGEAPRGETELPVVDPSVYELGAELARGGFGRLIRARDRRLDRFVAIKQLRATNAQLEARFRLEARLTARLAHPAIVPVHEVGRWPSGEPFYAMKLVTGRSLRERIDAAPALADRLALLPQVTTVADAVAHAHAESILHRDLKPSNIMIGEAGEAYVVDWGLAKDLRGDDIATPELISADATLTSAGAILGTPPYLPPEQARGDAVDERADVYSLGALLYELVTATTPYTGDAQAVLGAIAAGPPPAVEARQPAVPRELAAIIGRAMARDKAERYPTARELADDLRSFMRGDLVSAYRYSAAQRARRWVRRHRAVALAALGAVAAAGASAAYFASRTPPVTWRPQIRELAAFEENSNGPNFSPDGTLIAYDSDRSENLVKVFVGPLDGPQRPITAGETRAAGVRFMRDGKAVLYWGRSGFYRTELTGGAAVLVAPDARVADDCGTQLVWAQLTENVCPTCAWQIMSSTGGELLRLRPGQLVRAMRCDHRGRQLAFITAQDFGSAGTLTILDLATRTSHEIADRARMGFPAWLPDDRSLVVSSDRGGATNLWEFGLDGGEPIQLTFGGGPDLGADVSADGRLLAFDVDVTTTALWQLRVGDPVPKQLTNTVESIHEPATTADGSRVAFRLDRRDGSHEIVVRELGTDEDHTIGQGSHPRFTPDGQSVIWVENDGTITKATIPSGTRRALARIPGAQNTFVDVSGTTHVLATTDGALHVFRIAPDGAVEPDGPAPYLGTLPAPHGGAAVVIARDHVQLVPAGKHPGDPGIVRVRGFSDWIENGTAIVYAAGDAIHRVEVASGADSVLFSSPGLDEVCATQDGQVMYFTRTIGRVRRQLITNFADHPRPQ